MKGIGGTRSVETKSRDDGSEGIEYRSRTFPFATRSSVGNEVVVTAMATSRVRKRLVGRRRPNFAQFLGGQRKIGAPCTSPPQNILRFRNRRQRLTSDLDAQDDYSAIHTLADGYASTSRDKNAVHQGPLSPLFPLLLIFRRLKMSLFSSRKRCLSSPYRPTT
jgi:hypothetical protein